MAKKEHEQNIVPPRPAAAGSSTVAVVDDDLSVRRGLKRLLQAKDCQVHTFASAEEFLTSRARLQVDIALVDIHLPGMNGIELLRRLESEGAGPPVILMTAHGEAETMDALLSAGRKFCLRKPFTLQQLLEAMAAS